MDVDVYRQVMLDAEYEFQLSAEPKTIVDAGAHIGLASLWFANRYPDATIIAIELEPANYEMLRRNTAHCPNVHAVHAALWAKDEPVHLTDPGRGSWGFVASTNGSGQPVPAVTIAGLMETFGLERIDLLKLDIEGAERDVLTESGAWLPHVEAVVAELHDSINPGCSRAFYLATADFGDVQYVGENVFVSR